MKGDKTKFLRIYYWIVLIAVLSSIIISLISQIAGSYFPYYIVTFIKITMPITMFLSLVHTGIFILSIFALWNFIKNKFSPITMIIPAYIILFELVGLVELIVILVNNPQVFKTTTIENLRSILHFPAVINWIIKLIKVGLSGYILYKFRK